MYVTDREATPAGSFSGPLVVSMRPIPRRDLARVVEHTGRLPNAHGAPIHVGLARDLGIADLAEPDYGDPVPVRDDEVPVFWPCGVTAQAAAVCGRIPRMISHAPGHMFVTDLPLDRVSRRPE
jgi:uncharacterized protein YcsI (UPF0317 family)